MNDFTKDELEEILNCCKCTISEYQTKLNELENIYELCEKIQSMIDNYCAHYETYTDFDYCAERCKECLGIVNE